MKQLVSVTAARTPAGEQLEAAREVLILALQALSLTLVGGQKSSGDDGLPPAKLKVMHVTWSVGATVRRRLSCRIRTCLRTLGHEL